MFCKTAQMFDKEPFPGTNLRLFLGNWGKILRDFYEEGQTIISFKQFLCNTEEELEKIGQFFQVAIQAIQRQR